MGQENQKPKQKRGGLTADLIKGPVYDPIVQAGSGRRSDDGRPDSAILQTGRDIVDVHRRNAARSKLAPTGERAHLKPGRLSGRLALLLIVAPR
jgi:hypothetical protein